MQNNSTYAAFGTKEAAALVGLSFNKVHYLDRTGCVKPSATPGKRTRGKERIYSFSDLVLLSVAKNLFSLGMTSQNLKEALQHLHSILNSAPPPFHGYLFFTDAQNFHRCTTSCHELTSDLLDMRGGFNQIIIVDIDDIAKKIISSIEQLKESA